MHKTTITVILFFEFVIHSFILPPFIVSVQWLRIKWWQTDRSADKAILPFTDDVANVGFQDAKNILSLRMLDNEELHIICC